MSQLDKRRPCPERARITSTALPVECPYSGHSTGNGLRLTIKTGCFIVRICAAAGRPFEVGRRPDRQVVMTRDRRGGRPGAAVVPRDGRRDGRRACHAEDRILHRWIQVMSSRVMASRTTKTTSPTSIATPMTRARARRRTAAGRRPTKDSMGVGLCRRRFGFQSRTRGEHTRRLCHSNSLRSPAYLTLALLLTHRTPSTLSMDDSCDCGSSEVPMSTSR